MGSGMSGMRFVPATLALLAVAACGGDGGGAPQGGQPPSGPATGGATTTTATTTSTEGAATGTYTFAVDNTGAATHDLVIKGPGVDSARTNLLKRGDKGEITVTLQPGSYELWCSVGNHRSRGMQTTITVG